VVEEHDYAVMGGLADATTAYLKEHYRTGLSRGDILKLTATALGQGDAGHRSIPARDLEVAVLDRTRTLDRKFKRLSGQALLGILGEPAPAESGDGPDAAPEAPEVPATDVVDAPGEEPPVAP